MRDWNEASPAITPEGIQQIIKAMGEIEAGRKPETQWEVDHYGAALETGFVAGPAKELKDGLNAIYQAVVEARAKPAQERLEIFKRMTTAFLEKHDPTFRKDGKKDN